MREFFINTIDKVVIGLVKLRSKLYLYPLNKTRGESAEYFDKWKKAYPKTFDTSKNPTPLNDIAAALLDVSPLPVPKTESLGCKRYDVVVIPEPTEQEVNVTFPPEESEGYSGH
jgi:hypothetical protein